MTSSKNLNSHEKTNTLPSSIQKSRRNQWDESNGGQNEFTVSKEQQNGKTGPAKSQSHNSSWADRGGESVDRNLTNESYPPGAQRRSRPWSGQKELRNEGSPDEEFPTKEQNMMENG